MQTNVDQVIEIIEERKQDVFDVVDNQTTKSLESLSKKKVDSQVKLIKSAIEQTKALLKRSFSTEILGFSETFDTILQEQGTQQNRDTEYIPRFSFTKSEKLIKLLNNEGIGIGSIARTACVVNFVTKRLIFTYLFSVVIDIHISQKAKYSFVVNNSSGLFFVLINNSVNALFLVFNVS